MLNLHSFEMEMLDDHSKETHVFDCCGFHHRDRSLLDSPFKPTVSNIRMATDQTGKTVTSTYGPGDQFYVFADLSGINRGSVIEARWYAVNTAGLDPNSLLNTSNYIYQSGISFVSFQLTTKDGSDWPTGSYRVELYLEGAKLGDLGFAVQ